MNKRKLVQEIEWPSRDFNIEIWSMRAATGGRRSMYMRAIATHRPTGIVGGSGARDPQVAIALAIKRATRIVEAYDLLDISREERERWRPPTRYGRHRAGRTIR